MAVLRVVIGVVVFMLIIYIPMSYVVSKGELIVAMLFFSIIVTIWIASNWNKK